MSSGAPDHGLDRLILRLFARNKEGRIVAAQTLPPAGGIARTSGRTLPPPGSAGAEMRPAHLAEPDVAITRRSGSESPKGRAGRGAPL
ncbi:hypothetical protein GALLR39Z86_28540 [Glycomyces algeriensis]|uniref:Uncharacterized protein n=1 Tax=Glycomyces algeriensis TaxID=256037 RepID=A0A9W6LHN4_9ACTN|nr:hypothetical protein GALLR39Z86_28540 [Glycomyces algeriensis]